MSQSPRSPPKPARARPFPEDAPPPRRPPPRSGRRFVSDSPRSHYVKLCDASGVASLTVFLFGLGFCAYTLFVYPLLLALLAHARNRPVRKAPKHATVSVILPVYNGEPWIAAKLESILALD